eukprot:GHVU01004526.1.p1 GENE.GHVU01004526.1~~GHVU01004526.1.p1  ORF type:complete len:175 (-),score=0.45 GHVU01004526.1:65-589(-)
MPLKRHDCGAYIQIGTERVCLHTLAVPHTLILHIQSQHSHHQARARLVNSMAHPSAWAHDVLLSSHSRPRAARSRGLFNARQSIPGPTTSFDAPRTEKGTPASKSLAESVSQSAGSVGRSVGRYTIPRSHSELIAYVTQLTWPDSVLEVADDHENSRRRWLHSGPFEASSSSGI